MANRILILMGHLHRLNWCWFLDRKEVRFIRDHHGFLLIYLLLFLHLHLCSCWSVSLCLTLILGSGGLGRTISQASESDVAETQNNLAVGHHDCTEEDVVTEEGIPTKHRSRSVGDKINTNQAPQ